MRCLTALPALILAAFSLEATEIPKGAHLLLRMVNSINTRTAREGDYVYLRTASPIIAEGRIIVPTESYVQGVVSRARQSGRIRGRGELSIRLETLTLPAGQSYRIAPRLASVEAHDTGQIAILAGSGAAIGALADRSFKGAGIGAGIGTAVGLAKVLATRGAQVDLRQGTTLDVVFDRPIALE